MANCVVCGEDLGTGPECARCGHRNEELPDVTIGYFVNGWGILSFLLILPPLLMLLPGISRRSANLLQPIVSTLLGPLFALVVTAIISWYVFSLRDALYYHSLKRSFKAKPGKSLAFWALVLFVAAILLAFVLGFAITAKDSIIGPPGYPQALLQGMVAYGGLWHQLIKLVMTGVFIFVFAFLALSASLMAAYKYGRYVDAAHPAPIFMNERLLVWLVLDAVEKHLEAVGPMARDAERARGQEPPDLEGGLSISGMARLENGGIALTVHNVGKIQPRDNISVREDRTWYVEADEWGHLSKVEEKSLRVTKVEDKSLSVPRVEAKGLDVAEAAEESPVSVDAVLAEVHKLLGAEAEVRLLALEQQADGSKVLAIRHLERRALQKGTQAVLETIWSVVTDPKGRVTRVKKENERRRRETGLAPVSTQAEGETTPLGEPSPQLQGVEGTAESQLPDQPSTAPQTSLTTLQETQVVGEPQAQDTSRPPPQGTQLSSMQAVAQSRAMTATAPEQEPQPQTPITHRSRVTKRQRAEEKLRSGGLAQGSGQGPVGAEQSRPAQAPAAEPAAGTVDVDTGHSAPELQDSQVRDLAQATQVEPGPSPSEEAAQQPD